MLFRAVQRRRRFRQCCCYFVCITIKMRIIHRHHISSSESVFSTWDDNLAISLACHWCCCHAVVAVLCFSVSSAERPWFLAIRAAYLSFVCSFRCIYFHRAFCRRNIILLMLLRKVFIYLQRKRVILTRERAAVARYRRK